MLDRWSYGMMGANQAYPKALLFSVAAMTRNTDFSETVRQENLADVDKDVWLTVFSRAGIETLLIWKDAGAVDVQITVKGDGPVFAEDIYGNRFSLDSVDGKVFATVTQSPLYIMRQSADVAISKAAFQLASHAETVAVGKQTKSLSFSGDVPAS
eukprot:gene2373-20603_t